MRYDAAPDDVANAYRKLIRENIDYDSLVIVYSYDRELIDGIVDLILETVLCRQEYILIASNQYPASVVKSKFLKLNYSHIEYVLSCLRRNTSKVNVLMTEVTSLYLPCGRTTLLSVFHIRLFA